MKKRTIENEDFLWLNCVFLNLSEQFCFSDTIPLQSLGVLDFFVIASESPFTVATYPSFSR